MLKKNSDGVKKGFQEGLPEVSKALAFHAIYKSAITVKKKEDVPGFFNPSTGQKIWNWQIEKDAQQHFLKVKEDQTCCQALEKILKLTPRELGQLDTNAIEEESVRFVVGKIMEMTLEELQGGLFCFQGIKRALEMIRSLPNS